MAKSAALRILLIEPNADEAMAMMHAARSHDSRHVISWVSDGATALMTLFSAHRQVQRALRYDRVLLALTLPTVDGIEVLRRIRKRTATRHIPLIVLVTAAQEADIVNCHEPGPVTYLHKPVTVSRFAEAIEKRVGRRSKALRKLPRAA